MKKTICIIFALLFVFSLASCGNAGNTRSGTVQNGKSVDDILSSASAQDSTAAKANVPVEKLRIFSKNIPDGKDFAVDLTTLNQTMVYTRVSDMVTNPKDYEGKSVKMKGTYAVYEGEARNYYACLISDATACCSQGIEFELTGDYTYPDDYPPEGEQICVEGVFDTYQEGEITYCTLRNARMQG